MILQFFVIFILQFIFIFYLECLIMDVNQVLHFVLFFIFIYLFFLILVLTSQFAELAYYVNIVYYVLSCILKPKGNKLMMIIITISNNNNTIMCLF